jgi:hypothetical protein
MKKTLATLAAIAAALPALANATRRDDPFIRIGHQGWPSLSTVAPEADIEVDNADAPSSVDANFVCTMGGRAYGGRLAGTKSSKSPGPMSGSLVIAGATYPATIWASKDCDDEGCFVRIEAEASNATGETVEVAIYGR